MAIAGFEELCNGIAEVAGVAAPELKADDSGTLAFTLDLGDVPVTVLQVPSRPDAAYLIAEFGAMPEARAVEGWRALMEANLEMTTRDGPVFARNRRTGDVTLHRGVALADATPIELYRCAMDMAHVATSWRRDPFLEGESAAGALGHLVGEPASVIKA